MRYSDVEARSHSEQYVSWQFFVKFCPDPETDQALLWLP
jgi:hypothetical protein